MLDLQSLEANTVKDLVISQTRLVNQQKTKPFVRSRDSSYSSYSKDDKNKTRREGKSWTKSPERRKTWNNKDQNDKFDAKKKNRYRQRSDSRDSNKSYGRYRDTNRGRDTDRGGKQRNNKDNRDDNKNYRQRDNSKDRPRSRQLSRQSSRNRGSPVRLTGCYRCSSNNHEAVNCTRFGYYDGPKCVYCNYLHKKAECPFYVKDRQRERSSDKQREKNSFRSVKSVELIERQLKNNTDTEPRAQLSTSNHLQDANVFSKN